jgi:uncharacterized protein (DUF111 family)
MKKGRPGILLSVLTGEERIDPITDLLFHETTSIGVRVHQVGRKKLQREVRSIETRFGTVRVKMSTRGGEVLTATPEYEDCKRLAEEKQVPLKIILDEVKKQI